MNEKISEKSGPYPPTYSGILWRDFLEATAETGNEDTDRPPDKDGGSSLLTLNRSL